MKYLTERSLYYYFLMREVADVGVNGWSFIAKNFGAKPKEIKTYEAVLTNSALDDLCTTDDIEMYGNYLNGYCVADTEFGKSKCEQDAIAAKALALHKQQELFSDSLIKGNRLRTLSHNYERDHIASVLYAIQMLYLNENKQCKKFAKELLTKELKEGKNSDAGLILLNLESVDTCDTVNILRSLPDMLLRPDMLKYLAKQYGSAGGENLFKDKRTIGF
ncbi:MAG: hypothetical protein K2K80_04435 [Clostridia bacterium]|nr:hypothetical protein [Clostridia bacterium]